MDAKEKFIEEAKKGNLEYVKENFSHIQSSDLIDEPALMRSFVFSPSIEVCAYLLQRRPDIVNKPCKQNCDRIDWDEASWTEITALIYAVQTNDIHKVKFLIDHGADVSIPIINVHSAHYGDPVAHIDRRVGKTALELAQEIGNETILTILKCAKPKRLPHAITTGQVEIVKQLLAAGADVNQPDHFGNTPLILAITYSHVEIVKQLLAAGADANQKNLDGNTPLGQAVSQGNAEMVKQLLAAGVDANQPSSGGHTPLGMTVMCGHVEGVKQLLAAGADVNQKDLAGNTPLAHAVLQGNTEMVKQLLAAGADANQPSSGGYTPLMLAATYGHVEIVKLLLAASADVNAGEKNAGLTALQIARAANQQEIIELLKSAGAKE